MSVRLFVCFGSLRCEGGCGSIVAEYCGSDTSYLEFAEAVLSKGVLSKCIN